MFAICVGAFFVDPKNYSPFLPNGMKGVVLGASKLIFAYIGFGIFYNFILFIFFLIQFRLLHCSISGS